MDAPLSEGASLELPDAKRHHLGTVLRLSIGDTVTLFNGDGHEYAARVSEATRKRFAVEIEALSTPRRESTLSLTLVQAIARGDRMDFALAKAVELGVARVRPVFTERGQIKLNGERLAKKQAHWQAVAESAAEQSGRLICPAISPAIDLGQLLANDDEDKHADGGSTLRLMLAPEAARSLSEIVSTPCVSLLIGPESGLSHTEIEQASAAGWQALALGPRILRTETAGMAAIAALQTAWGDLAG